MRPLILLPFLLAACGSGTLLTHLEPGDAPVQPMGGDRPTVALGRVGPHLAMVRLTPSAGVWYVVVEIDVPPDDADIESLTLGRFQITFMAWGNDPRKLVAGGWFEVPPDSSFDGRGRVEVVLWKNHEKLRGTIEVKP